MSCSLHRLREKLEELQQHETDAAEKKPLPAIDFSAAYLRQPDGYQYEQRYQDYPYDTTSYGDASPPPRPPPLPADSAVLLLASESDQAAAKAAVTVRLLSVRERADLEAEWSGLRRRVEAAHLALLAALDRCNVETTSCPPHDVAVPDEVKQQFFVEPPRAWQSAGEDAGAYERKMRAAQGFAELQVLRYAMSVETSMTAAVQRMRLLLRKLEADAAEASGLAAAIGATQRAVDQIENRAASSRRDEEHITNLHRVAEAEERRVGRGSVASLRLAASGPTVAERSASSSGSAAQRLDFEEPVARLTRRVQVAADPLRKWSDLGACSREWMLLREAVAECAAIIAASNERRAARRAEAETRYDAVRDAMLDKELQRMVVRPA
jgi:hypothetical protein